MKVLAINSSPNMENGNTTLIFTPFLEGMREAGAEVEVFYTSKLKINPCQGRFVCWLKTPGRCMHRDDMDMLLPKIDEAEVLVLATPLYVDGMAGPMKNLLDRILPLALPHFEMREGHCRHPRRSKGKRSKLVLVSNCGFYEMDNFDPLVSHAKAICKNMDAEFAGALLRPHGPALRVMKEMGMPVDDVFDAARRAGVQLVEEGKISPDTLRTVSRPLLPLEVYVETVNQRIEEILSSSS